MQIIVKMFEEQGKKIIYFFEKEKYDYEDNGFLGCVAFSDIEEISFLNSDNLEYIKNALEYIKNAKEELIIDVPLSSEEIIMILKNQKVLV